MAAEVANRIGHWAEALQSIGNKEFARQLVTDNGTKPEVLERLRAAGLPVQPSKLINLGAFRADPSQHLEAFRSPLYWISVLPPDPSQQKYSISGVNAQEVIDFVDTYGRIPDSYAILLNFFEENVYGGQVMSNRHVVCVEMGEGLQTDVVHGKQRGELFNAWKEFTDISFRYSTQNPDIRNTLWRVLQYLRLKPSPEDRSTDIKFLPGYFEFAVTRSPQRESLGITFFDYKTGPSFTDYKGRQALYEF